MSDNDEGQYRNWQLIEQLSQRIAKAFEYQDWQGGLKLVSQRQVLLDQFFADSSTALRVEMQPKIRALVIDNRQLIDHARQLRSASADTFTKVAHAKKAIQGYKNI